MQTPIIETVKMENSETNFEVSVWLRKCGLSEHIQRFISNGYDDINLIRILNEEDLDAIGIDKPGTRKKILMYADHLRQSFELQYGKPGKPKVNSRSNPYRCTKCCEFKIRAADGKAHECKPELIGHAWEHCPTQNIRQHPEERQRRKARKASKQNIQKNETRPWNRSLNYSQIFDERIEHIDSPYNKRRKMDEVTEVLESSLFFDDIAKQLGWPTLM